MALVIFRQQRRVIVVDKAAEISRRKTSRVQISPAPPDGPDVGTSPKQNRNSTSSSDGERSPQFDGSPSNSPPKRTSMGDKGLKGVRFAAQNAAEGVRARFGSGDEHTRKAARERSRNHMAHNAGAGVRELRVQGTVRTMANAGEACSVVIWGWEHGEVPDEALEAMTRVTKAAPWSVIQPHECAHEQRLFDKLARLNLHRDVLKARMLKHTTKGEVYRNGERGSVHAVKLSSRMHLVHTRLSAVSADVDRWTKADSKQLLPLAFVTFESVLQARKVLNAARHKALFCDEHGQPDPKLSKLRVGSAPNPSDIRWEYLEVSAHSRARRMRFGYFVLIPLMIVASAMVMIATYMSVQLNAAPLFTWVPDVTQHGYEDWCDNPAKDGLCPLTVGRVFINLANWLWTTILIISAFQVVIQPSLWLATDGGPFGWCFAEATTSYTESCLHLMFRVLVFQIAGTVVSAFSFTFLPQAFNFPPYFRNATELMEVPPVSPAQGLDMKAAVNMTATMTATLVQMPWLTQFSRYWYNLGGACITNTIIGDATLINLVIDGLLKPDYLVPLLLARRAPTQAAMDDACAMTNVLFVPFRAQLLVKTLSLVMLFSAGMPILFPLFLIFCLTAWPMDRLHLLGRYGPPPLTNNLSLRFVLAVLLPPFLCCHVIFALFFFVAADFSHGYTVGESLLRGPILFYLVFSILLIGFVVFTFRAMKKLALKNGVLTPYQLMTSICKVDEGFSLAAMAATERVAGMVVALPDKTVASGLYKQPAAHIGSGGIAIAPPKSAWLSRKGQEGKGGVARAKLAAAVRMVGMLEDVKEEASIREASGNSPPKTQKIPVVDYVDGEAAPCAGGRCADSEVTHGARGVMFLLRANFELR